MRMGGRLCMGAARPYGERKPREKPEHGGGVSLRTCVFLAISGSGAWVWEMASSTEATPESAVAAPLQAIGMHGVPVTALPSGGLHPACAYRRVPSREAAETHPCRIHVWHCPGAPRTSLDSLRAVGAVQAGAAVGTEVVAGLYVDHCVSAHGALLFLANSHPPCAGIRFILLILAGMAPPAMGRFWCRCGQPPSGRRWPAGCPPRPRCRCLVQRQGCTSLPAGPRLSLGMCRRILRLQ